jgi:hypothetical protein
MPPSRVSAVVLDVVSFLFVGLPIIDWTAVVVLVRACRRHPLVITLRERKLIAVAIAAVTTVFALLGLARLGHVTVPNDLAAVAIAVVIVGLSLVNLAFLIRYWRRAF